MRNVLYLQLLGFLFDTISFRQRRKRRNKACHGQTRKPHP